MRKVDNYDWLHCIPQGWEKIGRQMIKECESIYPEWEITDLKEKFGAIRCYDCGAPKEVSDIIKKYEILSSQICCICGKPATKMSTGWICPYCDDCGDKDEKFYKRFKK